MPLTQVIISRRKAPIGLALTLVGSVFIAANCSDSEEANNQMQLLQTQWLQACTNETNCSAGLQCVCGMCTQPCSVAGDMCSDTPTPSRCVGQDDPYVATQCAEAGEDKNVCIPDTPFEQRMAPTTDVIDVYCTQQANWTKRCLGATPGTGLDEQIRQCISDGDNAYRLLWGEALLSFADCYAKRPCRGTEIEGDSTEQIIREISPPSCWADRRISEVIYDFSYPETLIDPDGLEARCAARSIECDSWPNAWDCAWRAIYNAEGADLISSCLKQPCANVKTCIDAQDEQ